MWIGIIAGSVLTAWFFWVFVLPSIESRRSDTGLEFLDSLAHPSADAEQRLSHGWQGWAIGTVGIAMSLMIAGAWLYLIVVVLIAILQAAF